MGPTGPSLSEIKLSSPGRRPWEPQQPVLEGARRQDRLAGTARSSPASFGIGRQQLAVKGQPPV